MRPRELSHQRASRRVGLECEQLVVGWRGRAAFSEDGGGDALRHHGQRAAIADHEVLVRLRLDVDEPRRHDVSRRIDTRCGARTGERSARPDGGDAVATQRDVAVEPGGAGSIDHSSVRDDNVIRIAGR